VDLVRSDDEVILRDLQAEIYDELYLEKGISAVEIEDQTILMKLDFNDEDINFLDFGCGTGRFTEQVKCKFPRLDVYGLDISPRSIKVLKEKFNIVAKEFDASKDSIRNQDFPKFKKILSMQMIQHLEKKGAIHAVNEIYTHLDSNGIAIIELYNHSGLVRILERVKSRGQIKKITRKDMFFEYRYGANEFKFFLEKYTPFENVEVYGCQNISRRWVNKFPVLKKIDLWLSNFSFSKYLGYYFIIVAKK